MSRESWFKAEKFPGWVQSIAHHLCRLEPPKKMLKALGPPWRSKTVASWRAGWIWQGGHSAPCNSLCLCVGSDRGRGKGCFGGIQTMSHLCPAQSRGDMGRVGHCTHGGNVGPDWPQPMLRCVPALAVLQQRGQCAGAVGPGLWRPNGECLGTGKWQTGLGLIGGSVAETAIEFLSLELLRNHLHNRSQAEPVCQGQAGGVTRAGSISASQCLQQIVTHPHPQPCCQS